MRYPAKILISLILLAGVTSLAACGAGESKTNDAASLTLQTYTVPNGHARELSMTLNNVLEMGNDKNHIGMTWFSGTGKIIVLAPERMQDSIAASIKQMAANPAAAKPTGPLRLNAWIVDAYPGSGRSDPSLQAIEPPLEAFSKATGSAHFVQAHYLTAVSDVGSRTSLMPVLGSNFSYEIYRGDGGFSLKFRYSERGVGLQGQVTMQVGQTLVLGLISDRPVKASSARSAADHPAGTAAGSEGTAGGAGAQDAGVIHRLLVVRITPANQD